MTKPKKDAATDSHPSMLKIEQILELHRVMSADEREALAAWEAKHLGRKDGPILATSDWPGWIEMAKRYSH